MSKMPGKLRPLGSVRMSLTKTDYIPRLSELASENDGIHGNAMNVPPPKMEVKREKPKSTSRSVSRSLSGSSMSSQDADHKKELKEAAARESRLKQQIAALERLIEELRNEIRENNTLIVELQQKLQIQESRYEDLLKKERISHGETKHTLTTREGELSSCKEEMIQLEVMHAEKIKTVIVELELKLSAMMTEKDKEISSKEEKLKRLKTQMADALKGNSWERQQQLEELTKELSRIQEEADSLRLKLKLSKSSGACQNCHQLTNKMENMSLATKERDIMIKDLKSLVKKYEKQLSQQDQLLKSWAERKGHKLTNAS